METVNRERPKQWAVVATGFIGPNYDPVAIADPSGKRCPVIIRLFPDKGKAFSMMKRLNTRHARVGLFLDTDWQACQPVYGVVETDLDAPQPRQHKGGTATTGAVEPDEHTRELAGMSPATPAKKRRK